MAERQIALPPFTERNHVNTGIPFRPSIRTGSSPANVARPRNHMLQIRDEIALKIIELAQRGVHDAPTLTEMTLKELKHCLPYAPFPSANAD